MWLNDHFKNFLFPEGIVIDPNDRIYWISDLNPVFGLIHLFTGVYDGENKKRTGRITDQSCLVDNSIEISNISFNARDILNTIKSINFILESWTNMILISPHPIIQSCSKTEAIVYLTTCKRSSKKTYCQLCPN